MSNIPTFIQWELIFVEFGEYIDKYNPNTTYNKTDFSEGVNLGREFSEPHMAIVISPVQLNKGNTVIVVPITNYTLGDERHWDKIVLRKTNFDFLSKDSSVHVGAIRSVSKDRISHMIRPFIHRDVQKEIKKKLCSFIGINI